MKRQEIYNAWKEAKRQVVINEDFSNRVLNRIHQYEREKRKSLFDGHRLIELISEHRLAKAGLVTAGAVTGFVRIMFVVYAFLAC